jgi:hypothetical protein
MSGGRAYFSESYSAARARFLAAARARAAVLHALALEARAPDGAALTIDIAWIGSPQPRRILLHSSGLHGVEGFAGSAIQLAVLDNPPPVPKQAALVLVHILNPYGMAWLRRANENNVDLNRNFLVGQERAVGASEAYRRLNGFLNPASPPARDLFHVRAAWLALRHGPRHLKQAIAEGQYEHPRGIFFGGHGLEKGPSLYTAWIRAHLGSVEQGFAIDVHTGLGRWCQESLFVRRGAADAAGLSRTLGRRVTADAAEAGVGYQVRGGYSGAFDVLEHRPQIHAVTQEFGTYPSLRVLHALREENRWHHYGRATIDHPSKARMKEIFAPRSTEWREFVIERGVSLVRTATEHVLV